MVVAVATELCAPEVHDVLSRIPEWWERRAAATGLPPEWQAWERALDRPPVAIEEGVSRLLEESPHEFGEAYIDALDPATRLQHGRHYTPALLAAELWSEVIAVASGNGPVVDPAAGAGALLIPPLRGYVQAALDPAKALREVSAQLGGTDLDPIAVWLGNALLAAELLPLWSRLPAEEREPLPTLLRVGDGLARAHDRPQTIVMNPPYGRVRLSSDARERWQSTLYGHANRYALFLQAAIERVRPGGVVAAVIPTSFLGGAYFQRLRAFVAREAPLVRLAFVDARAGVFGGDVLQETCLAIFQKAASSRQVACSQVIINGASARLHLPQAVLPLAREDRPWLLPRTPGDGSLIRKASQLEARLSDYGWKASTGPLVWNRHKPQIDSAHRDGAVPILWAADLEGGEIRRAAAREAQRWILLRPQDDFMRLTEPTILVQRTTAPEQPRRLVVSALDAATLAEWGGAVVVENHVNVLRCSDVESALSRPLLRRLLNTETFDRLYRCLTGSVAVSAYELEALPLPPAGVLRSWSGLPDVELDATVAGYYTE
ncbi:MAG: Eco57I restriction-modification methylase domain-containing protein [Gaiellaceae bacterium]